MSKNRSVIPGMHLITYSLRGTDYKIWRKDQHNARSEKLDILYKNFDRSYIIVDAFKEGNIFFTSQGILQMKVATIEDERGFMILTKPSLGTIVQMYHHRMPLILIFGNNWGFLNKKEIDEFDYSLLKKVA